jgi:hypothetical protein
MSVQSKIRKKISRLGKKAKRIFKITYEDITAQIFYDSQDVFALQLCRVEQYRPEEVLLVRAISREQAFHIMNTRN